MNGWQRGGDATVLAVLIASVPLLPGLSAYAGVPTPLVFDAFVAILAVVWLLVRRFRGASRAVPAANTARVSAACVLYVVAFSGAAAVGIAADNRFGSPVFAAHIGELFGPGPRRVDLTTDPFYPARVWLTMMEGIAVLAIVWRWCAGDRKSVV